MTSVLLVGIAPPIPDNIEQRHRKRAWRLVGSNPTKHERHWIATGVGDSPQMRFAHCIANALAEAEEIGHVDEREACATLAETHGGEAWEIACDIRARGIVTA